MTNKKLLIVVPYRDREENLKTFLDKVPSFFDSRGITYDILICELDSNGDWNAGLTCNSLINFTKNKKYEYVYIHHVDIYPTKGHFTFPNKNEYYYNLGDYGSCLITYENFINVGGYSNMFWGWGGEDNDLYNKLNTLSLTAVDMGNSALKFNTDSQNHERRFNAKNYAHTVKIVYKTISHEKNDINNFYENAYIKNIFKVADNIYRQVVHQLKTSPSQFKNKNVLLGYLKDISDPDVIMPFLKTSILYSSYEYDVVICIADENPNEHLLEQIRAFGATPYICKSVDNNICIDRYHAYKKFLETEGSHYNLVLHTDVMDVYFQDNPFKYIENDLIISSEIVKIKDERWNSQTFNLLYEYDVYDTIKDMSVLCGGIIGGPKTKFIKLCELIIQERCNKKISNINVFGIDQPILQNIIYNNKLNINVLHPNTGFAINIQSLLQHKNLFEEIEIIDNKNVTFRDKKISIVHQYNRDSKMYNKVHTFFKNHFGAI